MMTLRTPLDKKRRGLAIELVGGVVAAVNEMGFEARDRENQYLTLRQALVVLERERVITRAQFEEADRIVAVLRPDDTDRAGRTEKPAKPADGSK